MSEFEHFYHDGTSQPLSERGPIAMDSGFCPLILNEIRLLSSEIQIYQAISLTS